MEGRREETNRASLCRQSMRGWSCEETSQVAARTLSQGDGGICLGGRCLPTPWRAGEIEKVDTGLGKSQRNKVIFVPQGYLTLLPSKVILVVMSVVNVCVLAPLP